MLTILSSLGQLCFEGERIVHPPAARQLDIQEPDSDRHLAHLGGHESGGKRRRSKCRATTRLGLQDTRDIDPVHWRGQSGMGTSLGHLFQVSGGQLLHTRPTGPHRLKIDGSL